MRVHAYFTLPEDLLKAVDRLSARYQDRSEFVEAALRVFISQLKSEDQDSRDLDIINRHAKRLNEEAMDVLTYQVPL